MIKKLRIKLIVVIMGALLLIFGAVILTLNLTVYFDSISQTKSFISMIAENDGFFLLPRNVMGVMPAPQSPYDNFNPDDMRARRFFYVKIDNRGRIFESNYNMMFDFPESEAQGYLSAALNSGKASGHAGYFYYLVQEKGYGSIAVFAERRVEMEMLSRMTRTSVIAAGVSCILLLGLSLLLSNWMVTPIKTAFGKQRRFISDANHELKTPLTIVSANVDILQKELGDNIRFDNIRTQLSRMNKLIGHLLTLSKMEDASVEMVYSRFDLSRSMMSTALEFESRAFEEGRVYECDIAAGIDCIGDEEKLKSLLAILIDNALRHSDKGSKIRVRLKTESGRPRLSVYNTGMGIPDYERDRIFDRFYRSDDSRTRETGGYGLGLSIAKSIADAHKAKLKVAGEYGKWIEFTALL